MALSSYLSYFYLYKYSLKNLIETYNKLADNIEVVRYINKFH